MNEHSPSNQKFRPVESVLNTMLAVRSVPGNGQWIKINTFGGYLNIENARLLRDWLSSALPADELRVAIGAKDYDELLGQLGNINAYEPDDAQDIIDRAGTAIRDLVSVASRAPSPPAEIPWPFNKAEVMSQPNGLLISMRFETAEQHAAAERFLHMDDDSVHDEIGKLFSTSETKSCHCPAQPGEDCQLTADQCKERAATEALSAAAVRGALGCRSVPEDSSDETGDGR